MDVGIVPSVVATALLWLLSGVLAVGGGALLAAASMGSNLPSRLFGSGAITLTRGVPTSLLVVAAGVTAIRLPAPMWLPNPFPGTPQGLHVVAWAIVGALALGSTGHFAVIFRAAYEGLGPYRTEQATVLGLRRSHRYGLLTREAALLALPPGGARLVHHLHNTAFVALFPVADLFGWVQQRASVTFAATHYAFVGAAVYVALSGLIWGGCRTLESRLVLNLPKRSRRPHLGGLAELEPR